MPRVQEFPQARYAGRSAGEKDPVDALRVSRRLEIGDRAVELHREILAGGLDDGSDVDGLAAALAPQRVQRVRLAHVVAALDAFDERVRADREVLREVRNLVLHDVHVGDLGADVHQSDDLIAPEVVVRFDAVLDGEGVHVDDDRREPRFADDVGVVLDHLLLRGDQQHLHLLLVHVGIDDLKIERDVVDVVGNVLLGLPLDRFLRVFLAQAVHEDLLHDDRASRDGRDDGAVPDLAGFEQVGDRLVHQLTVHDLPVHDSLGKRLRDSEVDEAVSGAIVRQLDDLDRAGPDVEPYGGFLLTEHGRSVCGKRLARAAVSTSSGSRALLRASSMPRIACSAT